MLTADVAAALENASREASDWGVREISPVHMLASLLRADCLATTALHKARIDLFELRDLLRAEGAVPGGDPSGAFEIGDDGALCLSRAQLVAAANGRETDSIDLALALLEDASVAGALGSVGLDPNALASALSRFRRQGFT
jgi:hypothetical protein